MVIKVVISSGRLSEKIAKEVQSSLTNNFNEHTVTVEGVPYISDVGSCEDVDIFILNDFGRETIVNWESIRQLSKANPDKTVYLFTKEELLGTEFGDLPVLVSQVEEFILTDMVGAVLHFLNEQDEIEETE